MCLIIRNVFNIIRRPQVEILFGPPTGRLGLRVIEWYILLSILLPDLRVYKSTRPFIILPLYTMWYYWIV